MSATLVGSAVDRWDGPTTPYTPRNRFPRGSTQQFGPYEIHEELGVGGMGAVHRAEIEGAGERRTVALKRLRTTATQGMVDLFVQEAELASHLDHPNIARTYAHGRIGGTHYIEMEYVEGQNLWKVMKRAMAGGEHLSIGYVLGILTQLCNALEHAHARVDAEGNPLGIVHRDVSPSNVILGPAGTVKLIDFGVAKLKQSKLRTQSGVVKGKLAYVAPEYYRHGHFDHRADLFGLGVIAWELLTGRRLFQARGQVETMEKVLAFPIQPPSYYRSEISPALDDIVMTALSRDPELRWQSAAAMRHALEVEATPAIPTTRVPVELVRARRLPTAPSSRSTVVIRGFALAAVAAAITAWITLLVR